MSNEMLLAIVVTLALAVALIVFALYPLLKKRGVKTNELMQAAIKGLTGINGVTDTLKVIFPQNAVISIVDKIIDYAEIAVQRAEQLYHINEIEGLDRKAEAISFTYQSLELAGIKITPEVKAVVDGCIEAAVMGIGHYAELAVEPEERIK